MRHFLLRNTVSLKKYLTCVPRSNLNLLTLYCWHPYDYRRKSTNQTKFLFAQQSLGSLTLYVCKNSFHRNFQGCSVWVQWCASDGITRVKSFFFHEEFGKDRKLRCRIFLWCVRWRFECWPFFRPPEPSLTWLATHPRRHGLWSLRFHQLGGPSLPINILC